MKPGPEVLVVGAGVIGAWTASTLASQGYKVALADQFAPGNVRASSGGESRTLRFAHGSDGLLTEWAARSSERWDELDKGWPEPLLVRAGASWLVATDDDPRWERASTDTLSSVGIDHRWLTPRELEDMYAGTGIRGFVGALHEKDAGLIYARRSVRAVVSQARERGVELMRARVVPSADGRVLADGRGMSPDHVVWACGPWLDQLFNEVAIKALRQDIFYFGGSSLSIDVSPLWLHRAAMTYGSGDLTGRGVKINSDRTYAEADLEGDRLPDLKGLAELRAYLRGHFPGLAERPVTASETNQYEMSVNGDFIIDRLPGEPSWWVAGGGSGQAFKHAPMIANEVTRQLGGSSPSTPRFSFGAERVSAGTASVFG